MIDIKTIHVNPQNPRIISEKKFEKLKNSIKDFPKMLRLRPMVVKADGTILGGNMRFRAIQALGLELKPEWVTVAEELTPEEEKRFIIEDNVSFGEWDFDILANEWETAELEDWGIDLPAGWGIEDVVGENPPPKNNMHAVVIVAYENIEDLDKLTGLYELDCIDITEDIKNQISTQRKVYVFKK